MLNPRQQQLLKIMVEFYIKNAQPVASRILVARIEESVSSATVRNEMVELERLGYILQPHTSAGRIPAAKAYQFYVDNHLNYKAKVRKQKHLFKLKKISEFRQRVKNIAGYLAQESGCAVIVAFSEHDHYYTGFSNLFAQPEFQDQDLIVDIATLLERFDSVIANIYKEAGEEPTIRIGKKGYFGSQCGFVMAKRGSLLIGILGPLRMDYQKSYSILRFILKNL